MSNTHPTRHFTESEIQDLIWEKEIEQEDIREKRWSMITKSIVEDHDGRFFEITWSRGLTEMQDDSYYEGDYPEVFPVDGVHGIRVGRHFTQDTTPFSHASDAESLRLLNAEESYREVAKQVFTDELDDILGKIKELEKFDDFGGDVTNRQLRIATEEYINRMKDAVTEFGR